MQRQQDQPAQYQQRSEQEIVEGEDLEREYREYRISSRTNQGIVDVDAQSTLSDGLIWLSDAQDNTSESQRYQQYIEDGGTEPEHSYTLDFNNLRPSISIMKCPAYKEWYRTNIYNRWYSERSHATDITSDFGPVELVYMWLIYRQQPISSDTSRISSNGDLSSDSDNPPWHPVPPHLTATMTPPRSPSVHSNISSNRYSPLTVEDDDGVEMDPPAFKTSL